jgi:hypothetical protein
MLPVRQPLVAGRRPVKESIDWLLPIGFAVGGLFEAWLLGRWLGLAWVAVGYLGVFCLTLFAVKGPRDG